MKELMDIEAVATWLDFNPGYETITFRDIKDALYEQGRKFYSRDDEYLDLDYLEDDFLDMEISRDALDYQQEIERMLEIANSLLRYMSAKS